MLALDRAARKLGQTSAWVPFKPANVRPRLPRGLVSLDCLPDDLLFHIFAAVTLPERHGSLALVCKRWAQLVNSPPLLQNIAFGFNGQHEELRSFCAWLQQRAAGHVQQLRLMRGDAYLDVPYMAYLRGTSHDFDVLKGSLAACGAAGGLRELCLEWWDCSPFRLDQWAAGLRDLRCLRIELHEKHGILTGLVIAAQLSCLTALQELWLHAGSCHMEPSAGLPTSLTRLHWQIKYRNVRQVLPRQLAALVNLRHLELVDVPAPASSYTPVLTGMTALEHLALSGCHALPACLSGLTTLQALSVRSTPKGIYFSESAGLAASLPLLAQSLTALELDQPTLPATLASCTRLRLFTWHETPYPYCPRSPPKLPAGPWLTQLQQLGGPPHFVADNLCMLEAAMQLATIELQATHKPMFASRMVAAVLRWAVKHTALRKLAVSSASTLDAAIADPDCQEALQQLQHRKPGFMFGSNVLE